jgi:predicted nucleotidyltransferase
LDFGLWTEDVVADELKDLVEKLTEAHGENLKSVVLYGSAVVGAQLDEDRPKKVLVVLDRIAPDDLKAAHEVAEWWRSEGNPVPVYFTTEEMADSSDVFPIEFVDMSQVRRVLYGKDPFDGLDIPTQNLRHQLEYELRARLLRLRRLYIPASRNANQLARLMSESLDNFAVLFRHVLVMLGKEAPFNKRECVMKLAEELNLDKKILARIFEYGPDKEVWLESETNETFAKYLAQIDKVIEVVDKE